MLCPPLTSVSAAIARAVKRIRAWLWQRRVPRVPWTDAETQFGQRGIQYYVAGRFLSLSQQFPVCANLLHHSVEMFLKAALCRTHTRGELHAMKHNLRKAWLEFKARHPDPRLDSLDAAVSSLNKFERIRYPDDVLVHGMIGTFKLERAHVARTQSHTSHPPSQYALVLEDVDQLVQLVFEVGGMNPYFYLNSAHASALAIISDHNAHPFPPAT